MLEELKKEILDCRLCQDKFDIEPHPILMGHENSKIMQISQAPSKTIYMRLKPFNDASGKKLRSEWYHISTDVYYNPDNFYITSIAHCFPGKLPNGGDKYPPKSCARRWLPREMELVNNKIYLVVGRVAAGFFFPGQDFTPLVFRDNSIYGKPAYVLPHPSPLNAKWFKNHPEFFLSRIKQIERVVHEVLRLP